MSRAWVSSQLARRVLQGATAKNRSRALVGAGLSAPGGLAWAAAQAGSPGAAWLGARLLTTRALDRPGATWLGAHSARTASFPPVSSPASARGFSAQASPSGGEGGKGGAPREDRSHLVAAEEGPDAITDVIPPKPVTFVEGTSYSLVIVAALGFAAAILYAALKELLVAPEEQRAFQQAFERLRDDPRLTVRLGSPISAYGTESTNRSARQHVPHREYVDAAGREHVQIQFHLHGPGGRATVNADVYREPGASSSSELQYRFLYVLIHGNHPHQVVLARPNTPDDGTGAFV